MAGHRAGRPTKATLRAARRRARLTVRLAQAATPEQRLTVAADYLRGALRRAPANTVEQTTTQAVAALVSLADQLLTPRRGGTHS